MNTLFLLPAWPTFIEVWTHRLIEHLEPEGVILATFLPVEPLWHGRVPVVEVKEIPAPRWRRGLHRLGLPVDASPDFPSLTRVLESDSVSSVLVNYLTVALQFKSVWEKTDKPLVVHCHGTDTTWDWRRPESRESLRHKAAVRELSKRAILIIGSKCGANRLLEIGVPNDRIVVKYLGVPVPRFPLEHPARTKQIEVLYLGRFVDCKGPDLVIRAFELACEKGLDGRLTMAGDGPLFDLCREIQLGSKFRDRINLLGAVDATTGEQLRAQSDIFTAHNCLGRITHQEEVYGVSIVEAMAASLPVVSGRSGGLIETVLHSVTGILIEPGDIEAHAAALLLLAENPDLRYRMGIAGWQRAKDCFSLEQERLELRQILGKDNSETGG